MVLKLNDMRRISTDECLALNFDLEDGLQSAYEDVAQLIRDNDTFLVVSHVGPDGDAIGSTLGLCHLLWSLGKEALPFNVDPVPFNFRFLEGSDRFKDKLAADESFDVTFMVDCAQKSRIGDFPEQGWGDKIVVIDHHLTWDEDFGSLYIRDIDAAAVGEMVYRLSLTVGEVPDKAAAECLYTSLLTDTGGYRYGKTSTTTFQISSQLVAYGVEPWHINSNIYENEPIQRIKLLARVLDTLNVSDCGRLAFLRVDAQMLLETGMTENMLDGFINYARRVRGVEVATQLREIGQERYKISFRSSGKINVATLAEAFGGGGHYNAAGCVIEGDADEIQKKMSSRLSSML
jgi:phosphoesterase RecJ-like protein